MQRAWACSRPPRPDSHRPCPTILPPEVHHLRTQPRAAERPQPWQSQCVSQTCPVTGVTVQTEPNDAQVLTTASGATLQMHGPIYIVCIQRLRMRARERSTLSSGVQVPCPPDNAVCTSARSHGAWHHKRKLRKILRTLESPELYYTDEVLTG